MSFDVFVQRFRGGEPAIVTEPEVWALLQAAGNAPPDDHDYALVRRGDGRADLHAVQPGEPIDSLMFSRPAGGADIFDLIVDVARAGDMVILPVGCPPCLTSERERAELPDDLLDDPGALVVVESGRQLLDVIEHS